MFEHESQADELLKSKDVDAVFTDFALIAEAEPTGPATCGIVYEPTSDSLGVHEINKVVEAKSPITESRRKFISHLWVS